MSGSVSSLVFFGIVFVIVAIFEFDLSTGKDGRPLFVRKSRRSKRVRSSPKKRKSHRTDVSALKQPTESVEEQLASKDATLTGAGAAELEREGERKRKAEEQQEEEKVATGGGEKEEELEPEQEGSVRERSDSEESMDSAGEQAQKQAETTAEVEEVESDLLFSSKIPEKQEEVMRFFAVYNHDSYFATAYENYVRFTGLESMSLIIPLQSTHLASVVEDSEDHVSNFVFSSDGIYLLTAAAPSNSLSLHRVFHQLSKQPKLVARLSSGFQAGQQLYHIGIKTISEEYATAAASSGKELKLWEVNLKSGEADSQASVELETPLKSLFLYGKNDAFRTVHPGAKANGEHLFVACLMETNEVVLKDVTIKKNAKGKSVIEVTDIVSLSHFKGEQIEITQLAIKTETFKTSKYMLCGCTNNMLYLFKKGADKLTKAKGGKGSTVLRDMAKEVLEFKVESTEQITSVAIAPRSHMFVVACGSELLFLAYNTRNKTARIMERIVKAHESQIVDIQVSPEESYVATREMLGNKMKVWSLKKVAEYERFESVNESELG